jgi:hypothetical protein
MSDPSRFAMACWDKPGNDKALGQFQATWRLLKPGTISGFELVLLTAQLALYRT